MLSSNTIVLIVVVKMFVSVVGTLSAAIVDTTLNCLDWHWFTRSDPEHRVLLYSIVMGRALDNIYIPVDKDGYKPVEYESLKYPPLLWYVWNKKWKPVV